MSHHGVADQSRYAGCFGSPLLALLLLLSILVFSPVSQAEILQTEFARINHQPVGFAPLGRPLTIEANLEGASLEQVREAWLWYKSRDQDVFTNIELFERAGSWRATIPAEDVQAEGVDYYLEFVLESGLSISYPQLSPETEPVRVAVRSQQQATGQSSEEPVLLISPEAFSLVSGEVLVAISFLQSVRPVDPSQVRLMLNGQDITSKTTISEQLVTATLSKLEKGRQELRLVVDEPGGTSLLGSWSFSWQPQVAARSRLAQNLSGYATSEARAQRYTGQSNSIAREIFSVRYDEDAWYAHASGRLTSEEQGNLQPQHRFLVTLGSDQLQLRYGDISPRFNELLLWGRRVRGAEFRLHTDETELQILYGDLTRAVEGSQFISQPDDGGALDTSLAPGTYRRWLGALRMAHGHRDFLMLGLTALKARDATSSITYGQNPKDNLAMGLDSELNLDQRRFQVKAEAAFSVANDNINEAPLADAEAFKSIIWINQYFDPLPDEGLPTGEDDQTLNLAQIGSSVFGNSFSYKTRMRLRYYRNDLQAGYRLINRSFRSLGRPNLVNDRQGWFARDRIRLLRNRLLFSTGYERYWDNVNGKGLVQNTQDIFSFGLTAYTGARFPDINFSFRDVGNENDGTVRVDTLDLQRQLFDTLDTRRQNESRTLSLSLMHRMQIGQTDNNFTLSLINSRRDDAFNDLGDAATTALSLGARSELVSRWGARMNYSISGFEGMGGLSNIRYHTLQLRGDAFLYDRALIPYAGPRITIGGGQNAKTTVDPASTLPDDATQQEIEELRANTERLLHLSYLRIDWMLGFRWHIGSSHEIFCDVSLTSYSDDSEYEYWDGSRSGTDDVINRDDYLFMIAYRYRF